MEKVTLSYKDIMELQKEFMNRPISTERGYWFEPVYIIKREGRFNWRFELFTGHQTIHSKRFLTKKGAIKGALYLRKLSGVTWVPG